MPVPSGRDLSSLRKQFTDAGFGRSTSAQLAKYFNKSALVGSDLDSRALEEQDREDAPHPTTAVATRVLRLVRGLKTDEEKRLVLRFIVKRTYDFKNLGVTAKEEKQQVVRNVKGILRHINSDPVVAGILKKVLAANPDNLNSRQVMALRKAVKRKHSDVGKSTSPEPEKISDPELSTVKEVRKRSSENRFKRLTEGLTKKRFS